MSSAAQEPQDVIIGLCNLQSLSDRFPWLMNWRPGVCWRFRIWSSSFLEIPGHQDQNQLYPLVSLSLRPWILTTTPTVPRTVKPTSLCCSQRAPTSIPISHFQIASWKMGDGAESRCQNKVLGNTSALNKMEHWVQPRQVLSCHIPSRASSLTEGHLNY